MSALTPPTPENVAEFFAYVANDCADDGGNLWFPSIKADGDVIDIEITPGDENGTALDEVVHFRAVVVEGDEAPIVLPQPTELGLSWHDGGDMLALTRTGICLFPGGADEWEMPPAQAREMAAHLAAMADAYEAAAQGEAKTTGGSDV
ncbi:hypothetical protein AB0J28_09515 [Streptosporangium canum]|uniref:hypothetical protein n=1 Tax=Streptosporangium canum TaxID=324952 RepID=UPI003436ACDC